MDFDVDKINLLSISIDKNGLMSPWHPLFNHLDIKKSRKLLLPNGMSLDEFTATYQDTENGTLIGPQLTDEQRAKALEISNISDKHKKNREIVKYLNKLNLPIDAIIALQDRIRSGQKIKSNDLTLILSLINQWEPSTGGYQNAAINDKDNVLTNVKNFMMASTPMDGDTFSSMKTKRKDKYGLIKENPLYPAQQKIINMDGKDGIGIFAVGMKGYSGISMSIGNSLSDADKALNSGQYTEAEIKELYIAPIIANISFEGKRSILPSNTNINELKNKETIAKMILETIGANTSSDMVNAFLYSQKMKPDLASLLSELVTASTDNAKMLLLSKINATTDTSKMYITLVSLGFSPEQIVDFMINDTMDTLLSSTLQNVFSKEQDVTFDNIVKAIYNYYNATDEKEAAKEYKAKYDKLLPLAKLKNEKFKEEFGKIYSILTMSDEFSIIGSIFSINNGIKSTPYDIYAFDQKVAKYFKDIEFPIEFDSFVIDLYKSNNGDKEAEFRVNDTIERYNRGYKKAFNIFSTIKNNKHYVSQLVVGVIAKNEIKAAIPTQRAMGHMIKLLDNNEYIVGKLKDKQFNAIGQYIDDSIAAQYIENNRDYFTVNIKEGQKISANGKVRTVGKGGMKLDLSDPMQRQSFMVWFNNSVVPYMKTKYPNISLIKDLSFNDVNDIMNGVRVDYIDLAIDTTNFHNPNVEKCFAQYISDFKKLENDDILGNSFKDLMFIYNFVLTRNSGKKGSWSRLLPMFFKVGDEQDNILSNWYKYLASFSMADMEFNKFGDVYLDEETMLSNYPMRTIVNAKGELEAGDDVEPEVVEPQDEGFDMDGYSNESINYKVTYKRNNDGIVVTSTAGNELYPDGYMAYLPIKGTPITKSQYSIRTEPGSKKVLYTTIDRLTALNPNIRVEIINERQTAEMVGEVGGINKVRAFVSNGVVYINEDAASAGDVVHEFGHIALEQIKLTNPELFSYILETAKNHPLYTEISELYKHTTDDNELAEEVFMRLVGDMYDNNTVKNKELSWYETFKATINKFVNFVKELVNPLFGGGINYDANDLMGLSLEEVAKRFGDDIIKNELPTIIKPKVPVNNIISKLLIDNIIKLTCNG